MGISENAAAQLIWRARSKLREAMTAGTVASVVATSEECERAQLLLSMVQDGEPVEEVDRVWLEEHLDECGSCKTANRLLLEIGASYRLWLPVALFAGMRTETLTRAGELVGADWSHVPTPGKGSAASSAGGWRWCRRCRGRRRGRDGCGGRRSGSRGSYPVARRRGRAGRSAAKQPAASAPAPAKKSASAGDSDAKAAATGGKLVASRASGSLAAAALAASPVRLRRVH